MSIEVSLIKLESSSSHLSRCTLLYDRLVASEEGAPCILTFQSRELGEYHFSSGDIFECLYELRKFLEEKGWRILCNGSRFDAYPSGMARSMSGGYKLYIHKLGEYPQRSDLVKIFDRAEPEKVGTVEEQLSYHKRWVESVGL